MDQKKSKFQKYFFLVLAGIGITFGIFMVFFTSRKVPEAPILFPPPTPPFQHFVAGSGLVEASSDNVRIASPFDEIIDKIFVKRGEIVEENTPLYKINTETLEKELAQASAAQDVSFANLQRLIKEPRPENVPPQEALVKQYQSFYQEQIARYKLYENLQDQNAVSLDDLYIRFYERDVAKYQLENAQKNLDLLKAGAWIMDINIAQDQLKQAVAQKEIIQKNIDRSTIKAPFKGEVMQINVHPGEKTTASYQQPNMLFGSVDYYHIRVDVDEDDAWRVIQGAKAVAFVRGNSRIKTDLEFVRLEPYVVPKKSLTGDNVEKVDTRVLQLIYRFKVSDLPIYLGQIMDIYIEAKPLPLP
jgi:multidrug efflux pump subunit AcrA (membrane-fusion protein)